VATCRGRKATGTDSKFFASSKKGENHELREELRSPQRDKKRDAVKKVVILLNLLLVDSGLGHSEHDNWERRVVAIY
jgi:hypothetical protein